MTDKTRIKAGQKVCLLLLLTALLVACEKEPGVYMDGPVHVTMSASNHMTRLQIAGNHLLWDVNDQVRLRWADVRYASVSDCELLSSSSSGATADFSGEFQTYCDDKNLYAYFCPGGFFNSAKSTMFNAEVASVQTGRVEDLKDNVVLYSWIKKADIGKVLRWTDSALEFSAEMLPAFAILKMNVPVGLGITSIVVEAESALSGRIRIAPQQSWGSIGETGLFYRPEGDGIPQSGTIVIGDGNKVLEGDVWIVVLPDEYDAELGNYCCSTGSLKLVFRNSYGRAVYSKSLNSKIENGAIKDLGTIPDDVVFYPTLDASLKLMDGRYPPVIALDTASVSAGAAEKAEFFYIRSTTGFDSMGEPDIYDTRLSSGGIIMDTQNSCDRLYIKVLGRCDGFEDVYIKAVVRNWIFDRNYIAPRALESSFAGLDVVLEKKYQEATDELDEMVTYPRVGYVGVNTGRAMVQPLLGGDGWMYADFFGGSFKNTTFTMSAGDRQLYSITMPGAAYYYENSIRKSVPTGEIGLDDILNYSWSFKLWMVDMALLEVQRYDGAGKQPVGSDGLIEELK